MKKTINMTNLKFSHYLTNIFIISVGLIFVISLFNIMEWPFLQEYSSYTSCLSIIPVATYENADTMKDLIVKENKGKSGVYRWTNKSNNNIYVGSSTDLGVRFKNYFKYSFLNQKNPENLPLKMFL